MRSVVNLEIAATHRNLWIAASAGKDWTFGAVTQHQPLCKVQFKPIVSRRKPGLHCLLSPL